MINDSNPDFISNRLKTHYEQWQKVKDCYEELKTTGLIEKYLIQGEVEHHIDFRKRCDLAVFPGNFNDTVNTYASLLSRSDFDEETPSLIKDVKKINGGATTLKSLLQIADVHALIYGFTFIFVSPTKDINLEVLNPFDLRCPRVEIVDGKQSLTRLGIKRSLIVDDGDFGEKTIDQWYVYDRGVLTIYEKDKEGSLNIISATEIKDAKGNLVIEVPAVWYAVIPSEILSFPTPPFHYLANLSIQYFNKDSELNTAERKCNIPTWAREWDSAVPEPAPSLWVGDGAVIELAQGQKAYLIEPAGTAIAVTNQRLKELEDKMERVAQAFISERSSNKTATQSLLEASQSKASLEGMVEQKEDAVKRVFDWIMRFATPQHSPGQDYGTIKVQTEIKSSPNPQDVEAITNTFTMGLISRRIALLKLQEIGWLPENIDIELESNETNYAMEPYRQNDSMETPQPREGSVNNGVSI
jgi:hypothetical protein